VYHRPPLQFDIEQVLQNIPLEAPVFSGFLQENYIHFFEDIEDVSSALEYLSISDVISKQWNVRPQKKKKRKNSSTAVIHSLTFLFFFCNKKKREMQY
jgi:hypothetical protein